MFADKRAAEDACAASKFGEPLAYPENFTFDKLP